MERKPEALKNIHHIIVLMLENRSFDNLLGWLGDDDFKTIGWDEDKEGKPWPPHDQEFEGLNRDLWNPLNSLDANGIPIVEKVLVKKNGAPIKGTKFIKADPHPDPDYTLPHPDPGEGYRDTNHQLFEHYVVPNDYPPEPTNMGFVNNYVNTIVNGTYRIFGGKISDPRDIMTCYTPKQVPVLSTLAKQFAVCDHWYASIPSQTLPNRAMFHAGTSNGHVNNKPVATCDAPTIFNRMQKNKNLSWKVYASTPKKANSPNPKDDTPLNALTQDGNYYSLTRLMMSKLHDKELTPHFQPIDQFFQDAQKKNGLPNYAFLEPRFSGRGQNDQHPPSDIRAGEQLIAKVYEAIRNSPQWEETLLVITYDEHGGCYDHVPPPAHAKPPDKSAGQDGFTFTRFGVRVPTVLISPYIEAGTICRPAGWTPFDHTSVIATVQKCFDLDALESERVKAAPDLSCVLNLTHHRTDVFRTVDALYDRNTAKSLFNDLNKYDCTKAEVLFTDLHKLIEDAMTEISELLTTKS